jgi:anti-sigma B factor antagonist
MPVATFSTAVTRAGDTTIVSLSGDLDIATVPQLGPLAAAELDRAECRALVLDLRELTFLDSTGIGCWVETRTHATALGKRMSIRDVPAAVRRVLEIGGLLALFERDSAPTEPASND